MFKNSKLLKAVENGDKETVARLIGMKTNVNARNRDKETPLMIVAKKGYTEIAEMLIANGADIYYMIGNLTVLDRAIFHGWTDFVGLLIDKGVDINKGDSWRNTPLLNALRYGHSATAALLIEKGANVNARDLDGDTPLINASLAGCAEIVRLLIEKGADFYAANNKGISALAAAEYKLSGDTALPHTGESVFSAIVKELKSAMQKDQEPPAQGEKIRLPVLPQQIVDFYLQDSRNLGQSTGPGGILFQSAVQNLNNGDRDSAEKNFRQAIISGLTYGRLSYAYANLGDIRLAKDDLAGAIDFFARVLRMTEALYESVHDAAQYLHIIYDEVERKEEAGYLKRLAGHTAEHLGFSLSAAAAERTRNLVRKERARLE
jgi:hypothetical protein